MDVTDLFVCETGEVRKVFSGEVTGVVGFGREIRAKSPSLERGTKLSHLQSVAERCRASITDLVVP